MNKEKLWALGKGAIVAGITAVVGYLAAHPDGFDLGAVGPLLGALAGVTAHWLHDVVTSPSAP